MSTNAPDSMIRDTTELTSTDLHGLSLTMPHRIADALRPGAIDVELYVDREVMCGPRFTSDRVGNFLTDMEWPEWVNAGDRLRLTVRQGGRTLAVHIG